MDNLSQALPSGTLSFCVNEVKGEESGVQLQEVLFTHPSQVAKVITVSNALLALLAVVSAV